MSAGRRTKYDDKLAADIVKLVGAGCIVADVCARVGIAQSTYFDWLNKRPEFLESVNRAKGEANSNAVLSLRKAMMPHDVASRTTKTISETRLRKAKDKETGAIVEVPYTYTKTENSETLSNEFDWRAALEFLKRRDPDNWSEHLIIKVAPTDMELIKRLGFESASDAWAALMDNARKEMADAQPRS